MSTDVIPVNVQVPAHIAARGAGDQNKAAMGGIKAGSFPRISIGGSKFSVIENGEKVLITDPNNPELPAMQLELVVAGFNPAVSKLYYAGQYVEGSDKEPECSSDNGVVPDPHIAKPQHSNCAQCPQNVWGSKINEQGKQVKACSDNKRLAVIPAFDIENEAALDLTIKPSSLKDWAMYVRSLDAKGINVQDVLTKLQFDPSVTYPKLVFKFGRFLTETEITALEKRGKGDDVRLIISPRQTTATGSAPAAAAPAATPAPAPVAPAPAPAPVAPAPAPAPVAPAPAPAPVAAAPVAPAAPSATDPFAGLPPHVKAAVDAAGGVSSDGGKTVYKALTGKDVPTAAPAAPVDPYAGQPAHVKPSVEAAGGLSTQAGQAVFKALTGKDAPGAAAAPAPAAKAPRKRTLGKKTEAAGATGAASATPPAQQAPAAQTPVPPAPVAAPVAPAAAPAQSLATPSPASGLGADLDALLAGALATPAAPQQ